LQTFSQLSVAFLVGFIVRRAFLALGIFIFYFIILEPVSVQLLAHYSNDEGKYFPLEISDRMVPVPGFLGKINKESYDRSMAAIDQHVILTIVFTALIWGLCYWINKKKDLK
jgi:ABC-2 type transport system permease protein